MIESIGKTFYSHVKTRGHTPIRGQFFTHIIRQWQAWERGVMPGEATSLNAQNPRLLACFDALSNAQAQADEDGRQATR